MKFSFSFVNSPFKFHACTESDITSRKHSSNQLKTHITDRKQYIVLLNTISEVIVKNKSIIDNKKLFPSLLYTYVSRSSSMYRVFSDCAWDNKRKIKDDNDD